MVMILDVTRKGGCVGLSEEDTMAVIEGLIRDTYVWEGLQIQHRKGAVVRFSITSVSAQTNTSQVNGKSACFKCSSQTRIRTVFEKEGYDSVKDGDDTRRDEKRGLCWLV
uniref:Uncharacterized protein n=1 Tax=Palpitomonas bilix TaxID=652834 RepID=A0A7S3D6V2_9EUKA|mmetsp:Transcript_24868/g.62739  ORF Transcript_24868/g.62739 Transcript_24868/m.62739 type:complete len:110 (+) Transcript_24868:244-573(+)